MTADAKARGERARQIIQDDIFTEAWALVEQDAIEAMLKTPWWRVRRLLDHAARIRAIRDARSAIEAVMRNGRDAERRDATKGPWA